MRQNGPCRLLAALKQTRASWHDPAMAQPAFLSGQFLLAMPGIGDPRFERAIIAVCAHDEQGALGICIGSPIADLGFHDLLDQF